MILLINCVISALLVTLLMWLDRYEKENIVTLTQVSPKKSQNDDFKLLSH